MRHASVRSRHTLPALVLAAVALLSASAQAHVEIEPPRAPAGGEARLTFVVENERSGDSTRRIAIELPRGVTSLEGLSLRGWRLATRQRGAQVRVATLTAPPGRELTGDEHGHFRMRLGLPRREGATLNFKVLQTYDSGEIVRWIGPGGTSEPAPTLRLTAAQAPPPEEPPATETQPRPTEPAPRVKESSDGSDGGGPPIWAGIGLMLLAAGAGTALARRRNRRRFQDPG